MSQIITSLERTAAPRHILAALQLLQFQPSLKHPPDALNAGERRRFLNWCDHRQLTLLLSEVSNSALPAWVLQESLPKKERYARRYRRLKQEMFELAEAFSAAGLEFVLLKGLSHAPAFTPDALLRAQGDIDVWLLGSSVYRAHDVLEQLGYVKLLNSKSRHLSPMARPTVWHWRGDVFDPDMPISVELHYELWSEKAEHIAVSGLHQFWDRKQERNFDGHRIKVLCDADLLGFAALHLFLHVLHGEVPLQRAWEIARFLDNHASDEAFWNSWRLSHSRDLRALETCIFSLVSTWFGSRSSPGLASDMSQLPAAAQSWLAHFPLAPLINEWSPNKSDIWLHLAFITHHRHKARVLFRRLFPGALPSFGAGPESHAMAALLMRTRLLTTRLWRHLLTFFPTLFEGLRWFWLQRRTID